jgi:hypothetical protein
MAPMSYQQDVGAFTFMAMRFDMNLGYKRAGGINSNHLTAFGLRNDCFGYAMGGKNNRGTFGNFIEFLNKYSPHSGKTIHDVPVMHDLVADVDRRAEFLKCDFNYTNSTINAGTETAWRGKADPDRGG